jgi:hypothetical protein
LIGAIRRAAGAILAPAATGGLSTKSDHRPNVKKVTARPQYVGVAPLSDHEM